MTDRMLKAFYVGKAEIVTTSCVACLESTVSAAMLFPEGRPDPDVLWQSHCDVSGSLHLDLTKMPT